MSCLCPKCYIDQSYYDLVLEETNNMPTIDDSRALLLIHTINIYNEKGLMC